MRERIKKLIGLGINTERAEVLNEYPGINGRKNPELFVLHFDVSAHVNGTDNAFAAEGQGFSTIQQNGTGDFTITFLDTGTRSYRLVCGASYGDGFVKIASESTSAIRFQTMDNAGALGNVDANLLVVGFFK